MSTAGFYLLEYLWLIGGWVGWRGRFAVTVWPLEPVLHTFDVNHPFHKQITESTHLKLNSQ